MTWRTTWAFALQALLYALFGTLVAYFSVRPAYQHLEPGRGLLKVSFSHTGPRRVECPKFTPQEIAKRPPSQRFAMDCPRERLPLLLELDLDGKRLWRSALRPAGIARDGASSVYRTFAIQAGVHVLAVRLRDSKREQGFDWTRQVAFAMEPGRNFVVDFRPEEGGFLFRPKGALR